MKLIKNLCLLSTAIVVMLAACTKADTLPYYGPGKNPTLTASATSVAPLPADSNNVALTLNWTFANHATDSANVKYVVQIDTTGKNFANATTKILTGTLSTSFLAKELNTILLARGYAFNVPVDMDVRVISSYANNNEQLPSNILKIRMTPYKIPPKVALPASLKLFIVGSATQGGWNNPVPTPSQELARLDETTWGGVFQLNGGQSYLILPVNGDWSAKFGGTGANNSNNPAGDNFKPDGGDLQAPATSGWYKIIFDFQQGKFTVTPYTSVLPTNLFLVGDATPGGWNNPVPTPSQQFTRLNSAVFEITLPLTGGKEYLMLPVNGDWTHKYAVPNKSLAGLNAGGTFGYDLNDNFPGPSANGTYKITANFVNLTFKVQ